MEFLDLDKKILDKCGIIHIHSFKSIIGVYMRQGKESDD
jgi:hypothetical protein